MHGIAIRVRIIQLVLSFPVVILFSACSVDYSAVTVTVQLALRPSQVAVMMLLLLM